jgi:hypothetical protein
MGCRALMSAHRAEVALAGREGLAALGDRATLGSTAALGDRATLASPAARGASLR